MPDLAISKYSDRTQRILRTAAEFSNNVITIDDFVITGELGEGGMGIVLSAICKRRGKVAMKICSPHLDGVRGESERTVRMEKAQKRFLREVRALQSVYDPHLVPVYLAKRSAKDPNVYYYVMPQLKGLSASEELELNGSLDLNRVFHISCDISAGLAALSRKNIAHRDVTLANIWLLEDADRALLLDCGLARFLHESSDLTSAGMGTLGYAPLELLYRGKFKTGLWTDVFSFGCCMYRLWTGKSPFPCDTFEEYINALDKRIVPAAPMEIVSDSSPLAATLSAMMLSWIEVCPAKREKHGLSAININRELRKIRRDIAEGGGVTPTVSAFTPTVISMHRKLEDLESVPKTLKSLEQQIKSALQFLGVTTSPIPTAFSTETKAAGLQVINSPELDGRYEELYGKFDAGEFIAYHAPFRIEKDVMDKAIDVHTLRLRNIDQARYLFADKGSFARASKFFLSVRQRAGSLVNDKVQLVNEEKTSTENGAPVSGCSYFVGYHGSAPRCILYLTQPQGNRPCAAIVIDRNAGVANVLREHFNVCWESARLGDRIVQSWPLK